VKCIVHRIPNKVRIVDSARRRSGKLQRGRVEEQLGVAYDGYLYETSWSLQRLATGPLSLARLRIGVQSHNVRTPVSFRYRP
jgi:hypothetical protein